MNELAKMGFDEFAHVTAHLAEREGVIRLTDLAERFELPVRDDLARDHPHLWERGYLEVVNRTRFDASMNEADSDRPERPVSWTNYLSAGPGWYVLVPNYDTPWSFWGVLAFDPGLGIARPVFFDAVNHLGTFLPFSRCITSRGECRSVSCNDPTHSCRKHRGSSSEHGGDYFWCSCE